MNSNLRTFWENRYQIGTSSPTKGRIRPFSVNTDRFGYTAKPSSGAFECLLPAVAVIIFVGKLLFKE